MFASVVRPLVAFAASLGVDPTAVLTAEGIEAPLDDPDALVPHEALPALWRALVAAHPGQPLGLTYASLLPLEAMGVVGYAVRNAADGHAALATTVRFSRLVDPFIRVDVESAGGLTTVRLDHEARVVALLEPMEMLVTAMVRMAIGLVGQGAHAREVCFRHARRHPEATYRDAVHGAPVRFGAGFDGVVFETALLDLPIPAAEPRVAAYLEKHAAALLASRGDPTDTSVSARVRRIADELLAEGEVDVEVVAKKLARSVRTLQRELKDEGTSFSDLVDEVRKERAVALLRRPELGVAEVAFLLGYADARVFYRSFRRWTGQTPTEFRRAK